MAIKCENGRLLIDVGSQLYLQVTEWGQSSQDINKYPESNDAFTFPQLIGVVDGDTCSHRNTYSH